MRPYRGAKSPSTERMLRENARRNSQAGPFPCAGGPAVHRRGQGRLRVGQSAGGQEKEPEFSAHGIHLHPGAIRSYAQKLYEAFDIQRGHRRDRRVPVRRQYAESGHRPGNVLRFSGPADRPAHPWRGHRRRGNLFTDRFTSGPVGAPFCCPVPIWTRCWACRTGFSPYEGKITGEFFPPYPKTEIGLWHDGNKQGGRP